MKKKILFYGLLSLSTASVSVAQEVGQSASTKQGHNAALVVSPQKQLTADAGHAAMHKPVMNETQLLQHDENIARQMSGMYSKQLSLTPGQDKAIYDACLSYIKSVNEQRTGVRLTQGLNKIMLKKRNDKFKMILTAEQYSKFSKVSTVQGSTSSKN